MKTFASLVLAVVVVLAVLAANRGEAHVGHGHREDVAKFGLRFRTSTMQAMSIHMGLLAAEKKGDITLEAADRKAHGEAVRALSILVVDLFQRDTSDHTRSKPEIWSEWDRFAAMSKALEMASIRLAEATRGGEGARIGAAVDAVGKACGACHKAFRKPRRR